MTTLSSIVGRHRLLALAGAALLATPVIVGALSPGHAQSSTLALAAQQNQPLRSFADIVAADKPAVVTVTTKMKAEPAAQQFGSNAPYDDFFRQFFGDDLPQNATPRQTQPQVAEALGSGFIVSADGEIVTNNHVVDGATQINVTLDDGKEYTAKLVGRDAKADLAVLKIDAGRSLPTVSWGDSDKLRAGDPVLAIGNPFGIGTTVTSGIVSARGRDLHNGPYDDFIQVDAPINHGNSGGPLVDAEGHVVGINTAIYSPNGGSVGVGFAIPSDQAQHIVAQLAKGGSIEHGYIGVEIQPVDNDAAEAMGMSDASGALVAKVVKDSPAAKAGVKPGDVITAYAGKPVGSPHELSRLVADSAPGAKADLTVWRGGRKVDLNIVSGGNDDGKQAAAEQDGGTQQGAAKLAVPELGMRLAELTPELRQAYGIDPSVQGDIVTTVDPDKAAADRGIQQGDIVVSVNQEPVNTPQDVVRALRAASKDGRKSVLLGIQRGADEMFVGLPIGNA